MFIDFKYVPGPMLKMFYALSHLVLKAKLK